jgi:hypothetical protein
MSAARPSPADTSAERPKPTLSPLQLAGGALAAATSAVVASFFGVGGTVIGAALASVVSTISAALYSASLRKTNERLRGLGGRKAPRTQVLPRQAATRQLPAALDPRRAPARSRRFPIRLAAGAAAVFVAAMVIVTGIELIGQRPVSAMVTGSSSSGSTTVGDLANAGSQKAAPSSSTPAPSTGTPTTAPATPSATPEPTESSSASSSASSTSAARTSSATATPTDSSSAAATTTAPEDSSTPTP